MSIPKAPGYEQSLKDALVFAGLLDKNKAGRGRPSQEMKDNAAMLVADHGYIIKGYTVEAPKSTHKPAKVKHKPIVNSAKEIADIGNEIHPLSMYRPVIVVNGKDVPPPTGELAVCNGCRSSLPWCPCPSPVVNLDYKSTARVHFRQRNTTGKA